MSPHLWRRTWSSLAPFLALSALTIACAAVLTGSRSFRAVAGGMAVALLALTLGARRTLVEISGDQVSYRSPFCRWSVTKSRIERVAVPSNYRLLYIVIECNEGQRRTLPILNFGSPRSLSRALLEFLPEAVLSLAAKECLERLARGDRADRIIRWRQTEAPDKGGV